jgi:hypothetical protein
MNLKFPSTNIQPPENRQNRASNASRAVWKLKPEACLDVGGWDLELPGGRHGDTSKEDKKNVVSV